MHPAALPAPDPQWPSLAAWWAAAAQYAPHRPRVAMSRPYGFVATPVAYRVLDAGPRGGPRPGPDAWDAVEARWQLLGPTYDAAVASSPAAQAALAALRAALRRGHDVVLYEPDAYCPQYTGQSWQQVLNNVRAPGPFSAGLLAGMVLDGVRPWRSYAASGIAAPWSTPHPYPVTRARWP